MSSKLNVKQSKKERPRSSDKLKKGGRRDGTPEKSNTPNASQDALPEEGQTPDKKPVIISDEILALQIKPENLEKLREPRPPEERKRTPNVHPVIVRKLKPASEWDKPAPRMVTVAKPAPPDAPLQPQDYSGAAGLRFAVDGSVIPHSILGSVDDYKREASRRGELPHELCDLSSEREGRLSVKYDKKSMSNFPKFESVEESNALKNWQKRMLERRKQQDHLSRLLNKAPDQLVMNQADNYRKTQELRYIIDRTMPTMDYGKGYRVGSEFWKQQERVGDDLTGVHMTLAQQEKGYPQPIEHVGVPGIVQREKGTDWEKPRTPFHKPWHRSPYLQQRHSQLQPVISELDPHQPDMLNLEIVGNNQPQAMDMGDEFSEGGLTDYDEQRREFLEREQGLMDQDQIDDTSEPVFGPSLRFAGQAARWTGDSTSLLGQKGIEARVSFDAYAGDRVTSFLEIVNDGTTCIYYDWKKIPKTDPFEMMAAKTQRFYFNTSNGVILPGDTMKFPFVFKSPNAGVFSEQWRLETKPVVCGGAALVVNLRGVSLQKDKYKHQRTELEQELAHKQAEQIVRGILDSIIEGIRPLERPRSPVDAYVTEEEIFSRKNHGLYFSNETVLHIKALYKELFKKEPVEPENSDEPQEPEEEPEWNLSVQDLKEEIMVLDEEDEKKQDLLEQLNTDLISLSFPSFSPVQQRMYNIGYQLMSEMVDDIVGEAMSLRGTMGMPERDGDDLPEDSRTTKTSDGRKKGGPKDGKLTDKKPGGKDAKGSAKPGSKDTSRAGKATPGKQSAKSTADRPSSGQSGSQSPIPSGDPILEAKYKEKLYTQAFMLVDGFIQRLGTVFEEVETEEGGPKLPVMI